MTRVEQTLLHTFRLHVLHHKLQNHYTGVGGDEESSAPGLSLDNSRYADVHDQRVQEGQVVVLFVHRALLSTFDKRRKERRRSPVEQELVEISANLAVLQPSGEVGQDRRNGANLLDLVEGNGAQVGVRENEGGWECGEDDVAQLDAPLWNGITEREVVLAEEVGEVVQENEEKAKCATVEVAHGTLEARIFEEGREELEEGEEKLVERRPSLKRRCQSAMSQ